MRLYLPILFITLALTVGLLDLTHSTWTLRPALVFGFSLFCPGWVLIRLVLKKDLLAEIVLSITLSLVISTLLALILLLTHHWLPSVELSILILITIVGAGAEIIKDLDKGGAKELL